ncbi:hypothetical protein BKA69DRAFT_1121345 [Paraphysoderma sedebokerense]|nr:hypothetical protein BKA69DRAFT_1121345 [Paraphysoderma sedebokerense]
MAPKVFITSGEGFTGYYCVRELSKENVELHVGAANTQELKDLEQMKVKVHQVNPNDKSGMEKALKGMDSCLLIPPASKNKVDVAKRFIDACKSAGVKNVVAISSVGLYDGQHKALHDFKLIEDYAMDAGIENLCILRTTFYVQNILLYKQQLLEKAELPAPAGKGKFAPINLKDIAKLCAVMLKKAPMDAQHRNQVYTLTGSESLSADEMCKRASKVLGKDIRYKEITDEEAKKLLSNIQWLDPSEAEFLLESYDLVRQNKLDMVSNDFQHLCGSPPSSIDQFWQENKEELLSK